MATQDSTAANERLDFKFSFAGVDLIAPGATLAQIRGLADQLLEAVQLALEVNVYDDNRSFTSDEASTLFEMVLVARQAYRTAQPTAPGVAA